MSGSRQTGGPNVPGFESSAVGRTLQVYQRRREQILYLVVGGWNTLFGYGLWALMEYLLHDYFHYLVILVLSWPFSVLNAYVCYRVFVFRSAGSVWRELPRFSLVYLATLCAGLLALPVLLRTLPFNIYIIQAGYTAVVVVLTYVSHKFFTFGGAGGGPSYLPAKDATDDGGYRGPL